MKHDVLEAILDPKSYFGTRLPVEEATTLPPLSYKSALFYEVEQENLFGQTWVCVGYSCQVRTPGQVLKASIKGQPIVVIRDEDGELRAFYNVCRHRGSLLVEDERELRRFRCPYHSWTYDLKGKLLSCPLFASEEKTELLKKGDYDLLPVRVASYGAFIFVSLNEKVEPLSDYLGDFCHDYQASVLEPLELVRRKSYSIKANWKLLAENFLEYYHLPWVHPELCEVSAIDLHKRNQGAGMYMSFYASPLQKGQTPLDADYLPALPGLNTVQQQSGYFPMIFPNAAMFLMPHHLFVLLLNPQSCDSTAEYGDLLVHPSLLQEKDADEKIDKIFAFYDMVNTQDIEAVTRVQKGIMVEAYPGGRMNYRFEEPVHRFQNMVIDFMTGERRRYYGDCQPKGG